LKWLFIQDVSSDPCEGTDDETMFVTDAVFVKVFSLMRLEYFAFFVDTTRVGGDMFIYFSNWKVNNSQVCKFFILTQLTEKAYEALWEGPFADSIRDSVLFSEELKRLRDGPPAAKVCAVDQKSLEILKKLDCRVLENGSKFPKKAFFQPVGSPPMLSNLCYDFI
jgi:hypothetical protein